MSMKKVSIGAMATVLALTAAAIMSNQYDAICKTGTEFVQCVANSTCTGTCEQLETEVQILHCTGAPGFNCPTLEGPEGVEGKLYGGNCCLADKSCICNKTNETPQQIVVELTCVDTAG